MAKNLKFDTRIDAARALRPEAGRVPPHDLEAEAAVLSACLHDSSRVDEIAGFLEPVHFYADSNRRLFEAIQAVRADEREVDVVTVATKLRDTGRLDQIGGSAYLAQLSDATPAVAHIVQHAEIVRAKWQLRTAIALAQDHAAGGYEPIERVDEYLDAYEAKIHALTTTARPSRGIFLRDTLSALHTQIKAAETSGGVSGLATGLRAFDERLTGLHAGNLYIVAGRPGMGKTSFAIQIAMHIGAPAASNIMLQGEPNPKTAAVFSLEMPRDQLAARCLSLHSLIPLNQLLGGRVNGKWDTITDSEVALAQHNLWIDDEPSQTIMDMRGKLRRLCGDLRRSDRELSVVVVDYLQLMGKADRKASTEEAVAANSAGLKALAKEFEVPVIALAQLNRDVEKRGGNKRPMLSDLRSSGSIEQDADAVVFLYRDDYYDDNSPSAGMVEVITAKQRNGPPGTDEFPFHAECVRFNYRVERDDYSDYDQGVEGEVYNPLGGYQ